MTIFLFGIAVVRRSSAKFRIVLVSSCSFGYIFNVLDVYDVMTGQRRDRYKLDRYLWHGFEVISEIVGNSSFLKCCRVGTQSRS